MDVLGPTTMKNTAKCDTSCDLHYHVSHQNFERTLHPFWGIFARVFVHLQREMYNMYSSRWYI